MATLVSKALPESSPDVKVTSEFWGRYRRMTAESALPYQWRVLSDEVPVAAPEGASWGEDLGGQYSHSLRNLRVAAGLVDAKFGGQPFQDTDVFKWLESASYALRLGDAESIDVGSLGEKVDEAIDIIAKAQAPDGYLDSKIEVDLPDKRFAGLRWSHELYTMGHFIEAAVAHYQSTGSTKALDIARRAAGCIRDSFGDEPGKVRGTDGHPEIELALARLYEATGEREWLDLAAWFIRIRGTDPDFWDAQDRAGAPQFYEGLHFPLTYFVADKPALELDQASGHAVRLIYLATGIAKVGRLLGDEQMKQTADRIWRNIAEHRMYVTGNVGSTQIGEAFTYDDDLPNDLNYGETCASVGMVFFGAALMAEHPDGRIGDIIESELFNGALAGVSLDGQSYFYVNPLEADPKASHGNPTKHHVLTRRAGWFDCACCPANLTRLITSLDHYLYTVADDTIYAHQFVANKASFDGGVSIEQSQPGIGYPWTGDIRFHVENPAGLSKRLAVRIPGWAKSWTLEVNGQEVRPEVSDGFAVVDISGATTEVRLNLDMSVRFVRAATRVRKDIGQVAVARGPIVFCAEQADNEAPLWLDGVSVGSHVEERYEPDTLDGVVTLTVEGSRISQGTSEALYAAAEQPVQEKPAQVRLVPYYAWCNRDEGQMQVWFREA